MQNAALSGKNNLALKKDDFEIAVNLRLINGK